VSKLSGFDKPSKDKARAVSKSLLGALETTAPSRTREAQGYWLVPKVFRSVNI